MTTLTPPLSPRLAVPISIPPTEVHWTAEEFLQLGDSGLLEGRRAMLIDGTILEEGPMNPPHRTGLELTTEALRTAFGAGWRTCGQMPILIGQTTVPQPDLAMIRGSARDATAHPSSAALIVEVSDTSLKYDTTAKVGYYGAAGIPEYWVLDLNAHRLLVYRDPTDTGYKTHFTVPADGSLSPLAVPTAVVKVAELLP